MKTTGVVENAGHCIYSIGLKCFWNCFSLFHLVIYLLQSNTRYFVYQLARLTHRHIYIYIACKYRIICSDRKNVIKHGKQLVTNFLHIDYPNKVISKQCDKANKVHRASLFTHREKTIDNHIPLVQSYHHTIVSTKKIIIKEWTIYSNINTTKHLFCNSPVCAYRQPPNLKRMLVKCNLSRIPTIVGNSNCMKPRCRVCNMLDTRKKLQIPGTSSTIFTCRLQLRFL